MDEFPGNSKKKKEEVVRPKIEPVVTGEVIQRKKSIGKKFKELFFGGDFPGVTRYITRDVLLPAVQNLIVDMTSKGIERAIYGESTTRRRPSDPRSKFAYNDPLRRDNRSRAMLPDQPPYSARSRRHDVGEIIIATRAEAETVLERLADVIDKYEVVSVADFYDMLGLPTTYVDNKWGWTVLHHTDIRQTREGWIIDLPPVEAI